eukprot:31286-Pelagococcus_subviridis.AAC.8
MNVGNGTRRELSPYLDTYAATAAGRVRDRGEDLADFAARLPVRAAAAFRLHKFESLALERRPQHLSHAARGVRVRYLQRVHAYDLRLPLVRHRHEHEVRPVFDRVGFSVIHERAKLHAPVLREAQQDVRGRDDAEHGDGVKLREPRRGERRRRLVRDLLLRVRRRGVDDRPVLVHEDGGRGRGRRRGGGGGGVVLALVRVQIRPRVVLHRGAAPVVHHLGLLHVRGLRGERVGVVAFALVMRERGLVRNPGRLDARSQGEKVQEDEREVVEPEAADLRATPLRGDLGDVRGVRQVELARHRARAR